MSADNYNLIRRQSDGSWAVYLNLSASCGYAEVEDEDCMAYPAPDRIFPAADRQAAELWVREQEHEHYTEYGTEVMVPCRIYNKTACINAAYCDRAGACCAGDPDCTPGAD